MEECLKMKLGSTAMGREAADLVKQRRPGPIMTAFNFFQIVMVHLVLPFFFFCFDVVFDGLLVREYYRVSFKVFYYGQISTVNS